MKYLKYVLAFLIPIAIFCLCLFINKIAPFGDYLITIYDSRVQYPGFFMALKNMHFYLFNVGFGFNFYGLMAYYLMNPLNLLIKFFDIYSYNTFYFLLIILKIGLCGLSMQYFLSHEEKHDTLWSIIFSVIYALIGYIASYYYNVFWLDGIIMLPLILVGINKIVEGKSSLFYTLSLAISLILSFYTGYMSCIFSVIYFIYKLIEKNKYKDKKIILNFIISSIISALIASVVLVPTFFALMAGKASGFKDTFTKYFAFNDNIKYVFYSLTPGNFHSSMVGNDGFAQNFCTLFVVTLFITSFFNKKIDVKTKSITLIIVLFYMLSYSFNLVDYAWQFFQKPIWWQHRYSFTFSAFMIIIAYKNLMNYDGLKLSSIKKGIIYAALAILIVISFLIFYFNMNIKTVYRIFIAGFAVLLLINYIFVFDNSRKFSKLIIIILIFLELGLNTFIGIKESKNSDRLSYDIVSKKQINESLSHIKKDKTFYRMELADRFSYNDGLLFNYNGINYFNSVRNQRVINALEDYFPVKIDSHQSITLDQLDPYMLSLFDVKYIVSDKELFYFDKVDNKTYVNNNYLSLGFMVDKDILNVKLKKKEEFNNLSKIYSSMLNQDVNIYNLEDNVIYSFDNARLDEAKNKFYRLDNFKQANIYIEFIAQEDSLLIFRDDIGVVAKINDEEITFNHSYPYVHKGDKINIEFPLLKDSEDKYKNDIYYLKIDEYQNIMQQLNSNTLQNIKTNDKHLLEASIDVKEDNKILFTTIAYEKGMNIKVNGKKVKPKLILGAFIGLELEKGVNKITIDYLPQGLIAGIITSLTGIVILILKQKY